MEPANQANQAQQQEKKKDDNQELLDFNKIQAGDYQIHIFVQRSYGLKHPDDPEKTVDPVIELDVFGQKKYSQKKNKIGVEEVYWGDHYYIQKTFKDSKELQFEKLKISFIDHSSLLTNSLIGSYELDLLTIYFSENHALQHQWLALCNVMKNYQEITGFVKVSISVIANHDKQIALEDEKVVVNQKEGEQQNLNKVWLPPQIKTKGNQLFIRIIKGERFKKMDQLMGTIDPILEIECAGIVANTQKIENNQNPVWNKELYMPLALPTVAKWLTIKLWDYDQGKANELAGCNIINIQDIIDHKLKDCFWLNLYGTQTGGDMDIRTQMNSNPNIANYWVGRIYVSFDCFECENPLFKFAQMTQDQVVKIAEPKRNKYTVASDVCWGINLPKADGKFKLTVRWADAEVMTKNIQAINGVIDWQERLEFQVELPNSFQDLPDIFIYLTDDDKHLCYSRKAFSDYFFPKVDNMPVNESVRMLQKQQVQDSPYFFFLKPDKSITKIRFDEAGIVKVRLSIFRSEEINKPTLQWPKLQKIDQKNNQGLLWINLYQGKELIPQDLDGTSDPFIEINFYGAVYKSSVKKSTLNPVWNIREALQVPLIDMQNPPPIIVKVFDDDAIGKDFMGSSIVDISTWKNKHLLHNNPNLPEPQWIELQYNANSNCGKLMMSFNYFDDKKNYPLTKDILPQTQKYTIEIKALGLRDLKSFGIMPVQRAFVKFDFNSIRGFDKEAMNSNATNANVTTHPKETGTDPNICTIINFSVNLPKDVKFLPSLSCVVQDNIFKGLYQPVIGVFQINIQEYIEKTELRFKKKLEKMQQEEQQQEGQIDQQQIRPQLTNGNICFEIEQKNTKKNIQLQIPDYSQKEGSKNLNSSNPQNISKTDEEEEYKEEEKLQKQDQKVIDISQERIEQHQLKQPLINQNEKSPSPNKIEPQPLTNQQIIIKKPTMIKDPEIEKRKLNQVFINDKIFSRNIVQWADYNIINKTTGDIKEVQFEQSEEFKNFVELGFDSRDSKLSYIKLKEQKKVEQNKMNEYIKKHYRYSVNCPLEESKFMSEQAFDSLDIVRGTRFNDGSFFDMLMSKLNNQQVVGTFKGWINIYNPEQMNYRRSQFQKKPQLKQLEQQFQEKIFVLVRLYIINAFDLPDLDINSHSDPFLKIILGDQVISTQSEFIEDQANPDFYKMFELKTVLPGASNLHVQLWDYDPISTDELIGETIIDLEARHFNQQWRKLKYIPIETRPLYHPCTSLTRGQVKLWLEIIPGTECERVKQIFNITPQEPIKYELRVIVWSVTGMPKMDIEDTSDLYVRARIGDQIQQTDVHYRSQNGAGNFNWRMVFDVTLPQKDNSVCFQVYDKDILSPDDYISSNTIDYSEEAQLAFENQNRLKMYGDCSNLGGILDVFSQTGQKVLKNGRKVYEKFELNMKNIPKKKSGGVQDYQAIYVDTGKILISLELVPKSLAAQDKVGLGRSQPNQNPVLPEPEGRIQLSLNPIKMFNQLIGPNARKQVLIVICTVIALQILYMVLPNLIGNLIMKI